jgi:predicted SnoaL-like aldol condensation-catalyzing enzyme
MSNYAHETVPTQFVEAEGVHYAYRRFGRAGTVPLLFLGYFNSNIDAWDPAVTNLAADHEVILFDNAGSTFFIYRREFHMNNSSEKNKRLVLEAFDTLFNKRDYVTAGRYWSPHYIQHSAHIAPGREGLFNLVKGLPPTLRYEPGTIVADGDFVMVHGRFSHFGLPVNWIAADIVLIKDNALVEHWDVIQDEASREQSKSGRPMFGTEFP